MSEQAVQLSRTEFAQELYPRWFGDCKTEISLPPSLFSRYKKALTQGSSFFIFWSGAQLDMIKGYTTGSVLRAQELLVLFEGSYEVLGLEPRSVACKAKTTRCTIAPTQGSNFLSHWSWRHLVTHTHMQTIRGIAGFWRWVQFYVSGRSPLRARRPQIWGWVGMPPCRHLCLVSSPTFLVVSEIFVTTELSHTH